MEPVAITAYTLTSALGVGLDAHEEAFKKGKSGLKPADWPRCDIPTWLGEVSALGELDVEVGPRWESRNNRLAALGLHQDGFPDAVDRAVDRYGRERVGVLMGTSTSSIGRTEKAFRSLDADGRWLPEYVQPDTHHPHSPGAFVAERLGLEGLSLTISTACSSSARVFASAERWLRAGLVDAVVVGGVDTLCLSVIYGFHSLQLVAEDRCKPFDETRSGLNLGEAAGYALVERTKDAPANAPQLRGYGESSDAYHMSSAHPEGLGARMAIETALRRAGSAPADVDYLNLHGTSTPANDEIEGNLCAEIFSAETAMSATKSWTGHTLGAAGIVESVICLETLRTGILPATLNTEQPMAAIADQLLLETESRPTKLALTNSFGFGGNNCSLIFAGRA